MRGRDLVMILIGVAAAWFLIPMLTRMLAGTKRTAAK